jgi:hypothetical protein
MTIVVDNNHDHIQEQEKQHKMNKETVSNRNKNNFNNDNNNNAHESDPDLSHIQDKAAVSFCSFILSHKILLFSFIRRTYHFALFI